MSRIQWGFLTSKQTEGEVGRLGAAGLGRDVFAGRNSLCIESRLAALE